MSHRMIKPGPYVMPMPLVLVGAMVEDRPNFMTAAFCGIVNFNPVVVGCGLNPTHRTCRGVEASGVFSLNIPSADQVEVVDHVGIVSGDDADKSALFPVFTGELAGAPLIRSCPLAVECRLLQVVRYAVDTLYLAEVVAVHAEERVLAGDQVDWGLMNPLLFTFPKPTYWKLGERVAKAWSVGRGFGRPPTP